MILNPRTLIEASSISSNEGIIELELEAPFPEIKEEKGKVIFAVIFADNLTILIGTVTNYEEVDPTPDLPEQDVWARLSVRGQCISISL